MHFDIINKLNDQGFEDENLSRDFIKDLYSIKISSSRIEILEPIKERRLNNFELQMFEVDSFDKAVFVAQKLRINNTIYNSKSYSKLAKNKTSSLLSLKLKVVTFSVK